MSALQRIIELLDARNVLRPPGLTPDQLDALGTLPAELRSLYTAFGPGTTGAFSPVIHHGVVNDWPIWNPTVSKERLERSTDPLWQLTPAMDIWLDTHEVTILREDDIDESFAHFDNYWEARLLELETSRFDPMTGLWLPPSLMATRVDGHASLVTLVLGELAAGRILELPGIGRFSPDAPAPATSSFDHNPPAQGPSLETAGLDRLHPPELDALDTLPPELSTAKWIRPALAELHQQVDEALENGPVDLMGLFRLQAKHHEARLLPSPDEPVEAPAYRQVTARASLTVADQLAMHGR